MAGGGACRQYVTSGQNKTVFPTFYDNLFDYFLVKVQTLSSCSLRLPFFSSFLLFRLCFRTLFFCVLHSAWAKRKRKCCTTYATQQLGQRVSLFLFLCVCVCVACLCWHCVKINFIAYFSAPSKTPGRPFVLCEGDGMSVNVWEAACVCVSVCGGAKNFACCHSIKLGKSQNTKKIKKKNPEK